MRVVSAAIVASNATSREHASEVAARLGIPGADQLGGTQQLDALADQLTHKDRTESQSI